MRSLFHTIMGKSGGASYGALTTAWITATGETDTTIINSVNDLETGLNLYGLTSKLVSLYMNRTGNATKDAFDFINTSRSQAFSSGFTLTTQGAKPNGTSSFANTNINFNTSLILNNISVGYSTNENTNGVAGGYDMGVTTGGTNFVLLSKFNSDGRAYFTFDGSFSPNVAVADGSGVFIGTFDASKNLVLYRNATSIGTAVTSAMNLANANSYYGAMNNNGTAIYFNNKRLRNVFHGRYLTPTDVTNLTNLLNTFDATR